MQEVIYVQGMEILIPNDVSVDEDVPSSERTGTWKDKIQGNQFKPL